MIRLLVCVFLSAGLFVAGTADGQPSVKAKFYEFPTMTIDGDHKAPTVTYSSQREKIKFERLLKLKRSFFSELQQTAKDASFK